MEVLLEPAWNNLSDYSHLKDLAILNPNLGQVMHIGTIH